jgi:hypothetical protein
MKAINTSVHSTTIRAKPPFRRQGAGDCDRVGSGSNGQPGPLTVIERALPLLVLLPELELAEELLLVLPA